MSTNRELRYIKLKKDLKWIAYTTDSLRQKLSSVKDPKFKVDKEGRMYMLKRIEFVTALLQNKVLKQSYVKKAKKKADYLKTI
jgi:hypothetical protein